MNNFNGKVNINQPNISTKFSMMDKIPINVPTNYNNVITGTFENTKLSEIYFSKKNIDIIQNAIKKGVYDKSKNTIIIDRQSDDAIVTVMRSMYLQHSLNRDFSISEQINKLNKYVIDYCVNNVYTEAVAYLKYKRDISQMYTPLPHPIYSNPMKKGLELKPWF